MGIGVSESPAVAIGRNLRGFSFSKVAEGYRSKIGVVFPVPNNLALIRIQGINDIWGWDKMGFKQDVLGEIPVIVEHIIRILSVDRSS